MNHAEDLVVGVGRVEEADGSSQEDDEVEDDEDSWLDEEVAKLVAEQELEEVDPDAYKPQLMDETEMHSLRCELRTSESRIQNDGHLHEFVARRPVGPARPLTQPRNRLRHTPRLAVAPKGEDANDPFVIHDGEKREYAAALRDEVEQLNQLHEQYEETKRLLLDHLDMVCSTKPSERLNGQDVYEKLDELLAFAAKCALKDDR